MALTVGKKIVAENVGEKSTEIISDESSKDLQAKDPPVEADLEKIPLAKGGAASHNFVHNPKDEAKVGRFTDIGGFVDEIPQLQVGDRTIRGKGIPVLLNALQMDQDQLLANPLLLAQVEAAAAGGKASDAGAHVQKPGIFSVREASTLIERFGLARPVGRPSKLDIPTPTLGNYDRALQALNDSWPAVVGERGEYLHEFGERCRSFDVLVRQFLSELQSGNTENLDEGMAMLEALHGKPGQTKNLIDVTFPHYRQHPEALAEAFGVSRAEMVTAMDDAAKLAPYLNLNGLFAPTMVLAQKRKPDLRDIKTYIVGRPQASADLALQAGLVDQKGHDDIAGLRDGGGAEVDPRPLHVKVLDLFEQVTALMSKRDFRLKDETLDASGILDALKFNCLNEKFSTKRWALPPAVLDALVADLPPLHDMSIVIDGKKVHGKGIPLLLSEMGMTLPQLQANPLLQRQIAASAGDDGKDKPSVFSEREARAVLDRLALTRPVGRPAKTDFPEPTLDNYEGALDELADSWPGWGKETTEYLEFGQRASTFDPLVRSVLKELQAGNTTRLDQALEMMEALHLKPNQTKNLVEIAFPHYAQYTTELAELFGVEAEVISEAIADAKALAPYLNLNGFYAPTMMLGQKQKPHPLDAKVYIDGRPEASAQLAYEAELLDEGQREHLSNLRSQDRALHVQLLDLFEQITALSSVRFFREDGDDGRVNRGKVEGELAKNNASDSVPEKSFDLPAGVLEFFASHPPPVPLR